MSTQSSFLHNRSLLLIGVSESVSNIGNWITMMAVYAMVIFKGQGGVLQSSGIYLAGLLPILILSPTAGWLADHFNRKWLMVSSEIFAGISIAGLIFITQLEWIYVLLAIQAIFISLITPARRAVIPSIVASDDLPRANAFLEQLSGIIKIFAPIIAGAVLAILNPHQAIVFDVISFALSALLLSQLPSLPPESDIAKSIRKHERFQKVQKADRDVWSIVRSLPQLQLMFISVFVAITIIVGFDVLAAVYTRDVLKGDTQLFGVLISLVGVGTLVCTLYLMLRKKNPWPWRDFFMGLLLLACIPFMLALSAWLPAGNAARVLAMLGSLIGGFGNGLINVQSATLMQTLSPRDFLGRVGGLFQSVAISGQLVGILLSPILVPAILSLPVFFLCDFAFLIVLVIYGKMMLNRISQKELKEKPPTMVVP